MSGALHPGFPLHVTLTLWSKDILPAPLASITLVFFPKQMECYTLDFLMCDLDTMVLGYLTCASRWYHFRVFLKRMERYILDFPCMWSGHYDLRISYLHLPLVLLPCFPQMNGALHSGLPLRVTWTLYDLRISYLRLLLVLRLCYPQMNGALHPGLPPHVIWTLWS